MKKYEKFEFKNLNCERFVLGSYEVNTYLISSSKSSDTCIVVDPGIPSEELNNRINQLNIKKVIIFLTHGHADHIGGVRSLQSKFNTEILISEIDAQMLLDPELNLSMFINEPLIAPKADKFVKENDTITIGDQKAIVSTIRGHTKGGSILIFEEFVITGDTLFLESVGRSDFPGGNGADLVYDIKNKILNLNDRVVFSGHGPRTTIKHELDLNPFL